MNTRYQIVGCILILDVMITSSSYLIYKCRVVLLIYLPISSNMTTNVSVQSSDSNDGTNEMSSWASF